METFTREVVLESVRYYRTIFDWDFVVEEADYDARHEGVDPHRARQADPVRAGGGHELRQEGAGQVQVVAAGE